MPEQVRILRLLEYTGDRTAIAHDLERRGVKGISPWNSKYTIREAFLSPESPEVLAPISLQKEFFDATLR